jgi:hypothetical protein
MSDTPETDEGAFSNTRDEKPYCYVWADFARKLERERDQARKLAEGFEKALQVISSPAEDGPCLPKSNLPWKKQP